MLAAARRAGATTVLFGGGDGGPARDQADLALIVPGTITARVQEMHLLMLHVLSDAIDRWAADEDSDQGAGPARSGDAGR
jgi:D-sedoheptulose 7-phosphate isomerase